MEWTDGKTPYDILGLSHEANDEQIRKAFKTMALKKHPDKNKNNPAAAAEFGEVETAYRVLTDVSAKEALDSFIRAKLEREARYSMQSDKRRKLREDLNRREKEVVTEKREEDTARSRLQAELQRLRRKMEEEQVSAAVRARQATEAVIAASKGQATPGQSQPDEATQSQLGRTLKVVWDASIRDYQPEELRQIFAAHGVVEDVVVRSSKKKRQVSALVVMVSKEAAEAAIGSVNGDHAAPLLVMPLLKVAPPEQVGPSGSSSPPSAGTSHRNTDPYVAATPHSSSSQGLSNLSRSFPIPSQTMSSSSASSFPIPTPGTSANGTAAPPPGGNSAARVFSSFPGASSFQPPPGSGIGSGAAAPGGLGGVEGAILEKMKRAAERERMLREAAKEAEAEGS